MEVGGIFQAQNDSYKQTFREHDLSEAVVAKLVGHDLQPGKYLPPLCDGEGKRQQCKPSAAGDGREFSLLAVSFEVLGVRELG